MAEHHGGEARGRRVEIEVGDVVQDVEQEFADFDDLGRRQGYGPRSNIDIAADRKRRCNLGQRRQHLRISDVAGMDDEIAPAQRRERLRPDQAVGIGDHAENEIASGHEIYASTRRNRARRHDGHPSNVSPASDIIPAGTPTIQRSRARALPRSTS